MRPVPEVDLIVAVHDPRRAVARAVGSVLIGTTAQVRVTVVCHGLHTHEVAALLASDADDPRVRLVAFADGVASPAGPFNHGLDLATAPFTSVLGSDDHLEPGAIDSWLARAHADKADAVLARVRHADGRPVRTPPTRPGRVRRLDGVRDRLAYRSAPLGLVSRERFGALRFATGATVGEDIPYVNAIWFGGASVSLDRGPAYVVGDDAADRVTGEVRPLAEELSILPLVLAGFRVAGPRALTAYATKFLRVQAFGAVHNRPQQQVWTATERTALAAACVQVLAVAPRAAAPLSRADRDLLDAILDVATPTQDLLARAQARRRFGRPSTLVPRDLTFALHREAPTRFMAASVLAGRPRRRDTAPGV